MEPADQHEQPKPSNPKTEQERYDTERSVVAPESEITTKQNPMDMDDSKAGEPVYTSQWLRENTRIHGWLKFILYWYLPFNILCAVILFIIKISSGSYHGAMFLVPLLFATCFNISLSIVPICLFQLRKPNAVFYACLYPLLECVISFENTLYGLSPLLNSILSLLTNIALLLYFGLSKQVKNVIPLSLRKISKLDRIVGWVLFTLFAIMQIISIIAKQNLYVSFIVLLAYFLYFFFIQSSTQKQQKMKKFLNYLPSVLLGILYFILPICIVCFLSWLLCRIDPEKCYRWYSGIWHGIFLVPNVILHLFFHSVPVKATCFSSCYNLFFWISAVLSILGLGSRGHRS